MAEAIIASADAPVKQDILFGRLNRIGPWFSIGKKERSAVCQCECGKLSVHRRKELVSGQAKSCGCLRRELRTTHGKTKTPEYRAWIHMISRCNNPKNRHYNDYGGRGITVCIRWQKSFGDFLEDMGNRPETNMSIDRINNDQGYFKDNCRWATQSQQTRNYRRNRLLTIRGVTKCVAEWAEESGAAEEYLIRSRINSGATAESAVFGSKRQSLVKTIEGR